MPTARPAAILALIALLLAAVTAGAEPEKPYDPFEDEPEPAAPAPPPPPPPPPPPAGPQPQDDPLWQALRGMVPYESSQQDMRCLTRFGEAEPSGTTTVGGLTLERRGPVLKIRGRAIEQRLTVGAVADMKSDSEATLASLSKIADHFRKRKVDLIVVVGDASNQYTGAMRIYGELLKVGVPVLAVIGNREAVRDFDQAVTELAGMGQPIFSLNRVRLVDTPVIDLLSMPGYWNQTFVTSGGCRYHPIDVLGLIPFVRAADSPIALVSHGPPLGNRMNAIDFAVPAGNVGDPVLARLVDLAKIPFGLHANVMEAGGKGVAPDMQTVLPENKPHTALFLNTGPADGEPWVMNEGPVSYGMAAVVVYEKGKATYSIFRAPEPPQPENAEGEIDVEFQ